MKLIFVLLLIIGFTSALDITLINSISGQCHLKADVNSTSLWSDVLHSARAYYATVDGISTYAFTKTNSRVSLSFLTSDHLDTISDLMEKCGFSLDFCDSVLDGYVNIKIIDQTVIINFSRKPVTNIWNDRYLLSVYMTPNE